MANSTGYNNNITITTMAYLSKEDKKKLDLQVKQLAKQYQVKLSTSCQHYSIYVIKLQSSPFAFDYKVKGYNGEMFRPSEINYHWLNDNQSLTDKEKEFLTKIKKIVFSKDNGFYDESDSMTDYFHTAWYLSIKLGTDNKPYNQLLK